MNVAARDLTRYYADYIVPDTAVYEFANVLATVFGDEVRYARQGVSQYSVSGVASFAFKDGEVGGPGESTRKYIPQAALDIISAENGVTLTKRAAKWVTM
ncbi:hypothetical protein D3C71_1294460 [compost metagenome]